MDIKKSNKLEKSYVAGFLDGEAWVGLTKSRSGGRLQYRPGIHIANNNRNVLEKIRRDYKGSIIRKNRQGCNQKIGYILEIRKKESMVLILKDILPYLIVKKKQAKILVKFLVNFMNVRKGIGIMSISKKEWRRREDLYRKLRMLNFKGLIKPVFI